MPAVQEIAQKTPKPPHNQICPNILQEKHITF